MKLNVPREPFRYGLQIHDIWCLIALDQVRMPILLQEILFFSPQGRVLESIWPGYNVFHHGKEKKRNRQLSDLIIFLCFESLPPFRFNLRTMVRGEELVPMFLFLRFCYLEEPQWVRLKLRIWVQLYGPVPNWNFASWETVRARKRHRPRIAL